ncbi:hypothetical protein [Kitasatospora indigofera]|uniref:hypothetical protein n=1 Tax=Kitasatospora indigofera TaxID=67307 RepID=UPI0033A7D81A
MWFETRERLQLLAGRRGTTMRDLVEQLAAQTPVTQLAAQTLTQEELRARGEQARRYLREQMGIDVTDVAMAASARLRALIAERNAAAPRPPGPAPAFLPPRGAACTAPHAAAHPPLLPDCRAYRVFPRG